MVPPKKTTRPGTCPTHEHSFARRVFLGGSMAGGVAAGGFVNLFSSAHAAAAKKNAKRVILAFMTGGPSAFETWDPKSGKSTSGPYFSIPTALPAIRFCEYMPNLAKMAGRVSIIRSMTSPINAHEPAAEHLQTGHTPNPFAQHPHWGSIVGRELGLADAEVPNYVNLSRPWNANLLPGPGFFGANFGPLMCPGFGESPENLRRSAQVDSDAFDSRNALRVAVSGRFSSQRSLEKIGKYNSAYQRVRGMMASDWLFDLDRETKQLRDKYGKTRFGQDCLMARRLVEAGVPFVRIQCFPGNLWDLHFKAFTVQKRVTSTFDAVISVLIEDLIQRGLWDDTLLICMGEFGRTPLINREGGRDHYGKNWSMMLGGCGVAGGNVVGATNDDGTEIQDRPVTVPDLFRSFYYALGIDGDKEYEFNTRPIPILDGGEPVMELFG